MQHFLENYPVLYIEEVESTNTVLKRKVREQRIKAPFAVAAGFQTAGKGQRNNTWQSQAGKNVLCSFLVTNFALDKLPHINIAAASAICKTLAYFGISNATIKWPNDIFVGDSKIAGVLVENIIAGNELKNCIVGIGLNVNQAKQLLPNATSMAAISGRQFSINDVLIHLFQSFYSQLRVESTELLANVNQYLYKKDEHVTFLHTEGSTRYTVVSILKNGNLMVADQSNYTELEHHKVKWQV